MLYKNRFIESASILTVLVLVSIASWSCNQTDAPNSQQPPSAVNAVLFGDQPSFIQQAIQVQIRHENDLLAIPGVVGDGIGVDNANPNAAVIEVFTSQAGVAGIPSSLEGLSTRVEVVGQVKAFDSYTGSYSPVPCGVSIGNDKECAAGSIACLVSASGHEYMLSCNHVFARENAAKIGEKIDQPGRYDKNCGASTTVGTLSAFNTINFSRRSTNTFDAAIAILSTGKSFYANEIASNTPTYGFIPSTTVTSPSVNLAITKVGRTTGLTTGSIAGINVTIQVQYASNEIATFGGQIYVASGTFIEAGDSGSLMCTNGAATGIYNPVGLDFAGSSTSCFANPIGPVLSYFHATVAQSPAAPQP